VTLVELKVLMWYNRIYLFRLHCCKDPVHSGGCYSVPVAVKRITCWIC